MNLKNKNFDQLRSIMIDRYDGNAGEIILGFQECGIKGKKLLNAMSRYIENNPAYE